MTESKHEDEDGSAATPDLQTATSSGTAQTVRRSIRSIEAAAIAGVAYAVLAGIGLTLLARFPDLDQSDSELMAWFDDTGNQTTLILGLNLIAVSSIAFIWFVAVIRRRLGKLEDRFFSTVFLGSGLAFVAVWLAHGAAIAMPAVAVAHFEGASVDGSSASNAAGLSTAFLLIIAPRIQAVFVLVTSTLIMRSPALPSWLAVLGYVMAFLMFVVPMVIEPLGFGFPIWVFIVSAAILVVRPPNEVYRPESAS